MNNDFKVSDSLKGWDVGNSDFPTFRLTQRFQEALAVDPATDAVEFYKGYAEGYGFAEYLEDLQTEGLAR